jgi:hypothetical protein
MLKKTLMIVSILILTIFTGCSLFEDAQTEFVVKNHNDSTSVITAVSIEQYVGLESRRRMAPNALNAGTTILAGERVFFEIAPYLAENTYLTIYIVFEDTSSGVAYITYDPETKFKLVCNNNPGTGEEMFTIRGDGAELQDPID